MSPLLETLRCENGRFGNLEPHLKRMIRSRTSLWNETSVPDLEGALRGKAEIIGSGIWKIRVIYDVEIREVHAAPYRPRPLRAAALVDGRGIRYEHKFADRGELEELARRAGAAGADEAIIVRDGLLTDFTFANAAFWDGRTWWTPREPLLPGTRRNLLLSAGRMREAEISRDRLNMLSLVSPINAMLDLGEVAIPVGRIFSID